MAWYIVLVLLCVSCGVGATNCRGEEPKERSCENLCDEKGNCVVRAALLLPRNTSYDASIPMVDSALTLSMQQETVQQAFPDWVQFEWMSYDVEDCDSAYAVIGAIDAYNDCAHVFFGPSCDFALAGVARIVKFLGSTGIPIISTGGFSYDFGEPKQNCSSEFYMLLRAGTVSFKDIALFLMDMLKHYLWRHVLLIVEPEAQVNVAGKSSCHLMMKTLVNYIKEEKNMFYAAWDTTTSTSGNYTDNLTKTLNNTDYAILLLDTRWRCHPTKLNREFDYSTTDGASILKFNLYFNRFGWNRLILLYDTPAFEYRVGENGGHLLASNIHMYMTYAGVEVFGRELQPSESFEDMLLQSVGNAFASEFRVNLWEDTLIGEITVL